MDLYLIIIYDKIITIILLMYNFKISFINTFNFFMLGTTSVIYEYLLVKNNPVEIGMLNSVFVIIDIMEVYRIEFNNKLLHGNMILNEDYTQSSFKIIF